jgi:abhydrolase domain-containing protein 13
MWPFNQSGLWEMAGYLGLASFMAFLGILYYCQNAIIYPATFPPGSRTVVMKPEEFDMFHYDSITLVTSDGIKITGYLIRQETAEKTRAAPTILYLHANAGNMGHRLPIAKVLYRSLGCNIFMLSYRGYGLSEGTPSEEGIRIDAQEVLGYLIHHPDIDSRRIVLYGQSIGGAVALDLASRNPDKVSRDDETLLPSSSYRG